MKKDRFQDAWVASLKYEGDGKNPQEIRKEGPGFVLRVSPTNTKSFFFGYMRGGKKRFMSIGVYSRNGMKEVPLQTIRDNYHAAYSIFKKGGDPLQEKQEIRHKEVKVKDEEKGEWDFNTLLTEFEDSIKVHTPKVKGDMSAGHLNAILRACRVDFAPVFKGSDGQPGTMKIKYIQPVMVFDVFEAIKKRTVKAVQANRAKSYLSRVMSYAVTRMKIPINPCSSVTARVEEHAKQDNDLKPDQIKKLWWTVRNKDPNIGKVLEMSDEMRKALLLILVTGLRPGEVLKMHSDMIGLHPDEMDTGQKRHWLYIPDTKTHEPNRIYLTNIALELIGDKKGFIFQAHDRYKRPLNKGIETESLDAAVRKNLGWKPSDGKQRKANRRAKTIAKQEERVGENKLGLEKFTPHDLRHTASTLLANGKFQGLSDMALMIILPQINEIYLNHVKKGMSKVYNHGPYLELKKQMAKAVEARILEIIGKPSTPTAKPTTPAKVIQIGGHRKAA